MTVPRPAVRPPIAAYAIAPALVALATGALYLLQSSVGNMEQELDIRPFAIGYVLPVAIATVLWGRGIGYYTLILSAIATIFVLTPPPFTPDIERPRDITEILALILVGSLLILSLDATQRATRQARRLLADSEEAQARLRAMLDAGPVAVMTCAPDGTLNYANKEAERIWGQPLHQIGVEGWDRYRLLYPDETPIPPEKMGLARALAGEADIIRDEVLIERPDGTRVWVQGNSTRLLDEKGKVLGGLAMFSDITERKRAEEALRLSENRFRTMIEQSPLSIQILSPEGDSLEANPAWEALWETSRDQLRGYNIFDDEQMAASGHLPDVRRAFAGEMVALPAVFYDPARIGRGGRARWIEALFYPIYDDARAVREVILVLQDVSERRDAEEALRVSEARKTAILESALDCVITIDHQSRFLEFNPAAEKTFGYTRDEVIGKEMAELLIPPALRDAHHRGLAHYLATGEGPLLGKRIEVLAMRKGGSEFPVELAITPIHRADPPLFTAYLRDITERKLAEAENARLLAEIQARADRESLLNRIGEAQRQTDDPEAVQQVAVEALGRALGVDRCYFARYETAQDQAWVGDDWHRPDLPALAGKYRLSDYGLDPAELYRSGAAQVVEDVRTDPHIRSIASALETLGLRSGISVPLFDEGRLTAVLAAAMAEQTRAWTDEEVSLVAAVAAQTRANMDRATLLQRDRDLATRLQEVLTPTLPGRIPGLDLGTHYKAALPEANIGGDFFDVFPLEKGCIALVVGDLSGKGLAAAAQVSTVRNMLRYALYRGHTLAAGLRDLNNTLVEHEILTGFVTLFVGLYDTGANTFTYVSCGHEPALLRRAATGAVEELPATGPVLGAFPEATFEEFALSLAPGDALAFYTDGLSEAGRRRYDFFGAAGLAGLLTVNTTQRSAQALADSIVAGVLNHSNGEIDDDMCLLIALVEGGPGSNSP